MKAHDAYLVALLKQGDAIFNIPVYQRNYDWDTDNCRQLFMDIEEIAGTEKEHFIGSIVYISIGTATEPYFNIIDGQQRITSVMLFLKALHDSSDDPGYKRKIRYGFLINLGLDGEPKMKLKQVESDSGVYEKIVMQEDFNEDDFTETEKASNVYRNYQFMKDMILQSSVSLQELYDAVFRLLIIDVRLTTEDPQEVFESMNSTGKSLTNTDLLRNYLLMDLSHSKQEKYYKKYWSQIEKNVGKKQIEIYMVHYLIMKRKSDSINIQKRSSKINRNTLYDCFKMYFPPEKKKGDGIEELLADIYKYSVLYRRIVSSDSKSKSDIDKAIHEVYYELNAEPAGIFLMYLLSVKEAENVSDEEMLEAVRACISYVFRVRIFKGSVANQFFALAIQYFERSDAPSFTEKVWEALCAGQGSYRFPKDREFADTFENKNIYLEFKQPMIRYILYKYERALTKEVVEPEDVTIEHIMPQNTTKWQKHLMDIGDIGYAEQIHKIGNLTLTKMNGEASNDPFVAKKKVYASSGYQITRNIAEYDDWNGHEIKKRSEEMAQEALSLWPLPQKYNQDNPTDGTQFDMMDDAIEELFLNLDETIKEYYPSIYKDPKKLYVNYIKGKKYVGSIIPYQSCLMVTLNAEKELFTPNDSLEDITNKGHWGVGLTRLKISTEEEMWIVLDYIQQMIDHKVI